MTLFEILKLLLLISTSYPMSHILFKKAVLLDKNFTEEKYRDIGKFFYIPLLNVVVMFFYLVWMVIIYKPTDQQ